MPNTRSISGTVLSPDARDQLDEAVRVFCFCLIECFIGELFGRELAVPKSRDSITVICRPALTHSYARAREIIEEFPLSSREEQTTVATRQWVRHSPAATTPVKSSCPLYPRKRPRMLLTSVSVMGQ
jgi:hypothetical protein